MVVEAKKVESKAKGKKSKGKGKGKGKGRKAGSKKREAKDHFLKFKL